MCGEKSNVSTNHCRDRRPRRSKTPTKRLLSMFAQTKGSSCVKGAVAKRLRDCYEQKTHFYNPSVSLRLPPPLTQREANNVRRKFNVCANPKTSSERKPLVCANIDSSRFVGVLDRRGRRSLQWFVRTLDFSPHTVSLLQWEKVAAEG